MQPRRQYVDEDAVAVLCREIEDQFMGKDIKRPLTEILRQIDSYGPFAREFISNLQNLNSRSTGHLKDHNAFIQEVLGQTTRIRMRAPMWNCGTKEIEERERRFRVEVTEPMFLDASPVIFLASIYIHEKYATTVRCAVYDEDIADIPLGSKSLSKRQARIRRLETHWRFFVRDFPFHLEELWKDGQDLSKLNEVRWSEVKR